MLFQSRVLCISYIVVFISNSSVWVFFISYMSLLNFSNIHNTIFIMFLCLLKILISPSIWNILLIFLLFMDCVFLFLCMFDNTFLNLHPKICWLISERNRETHTHTHTHTYTHTHIVVKGTMDGLPPTCALSGIEPTS